MADYSQFIQPSTDKKKRDFLEKSTEFVFGMGESGHVQVALFPVETVVARAPGLHFFLFNNLLHLPHLSPPRPANNCGETHKMVSESEHWSSHHFSAGILCVAGGQTMVGAVL